MQESRRDFFKATATTGAILFATAVSLPACRVHAVEKTESGAWKPSSDREGLPLNHQQILKHLRTANEVAKETAEFGHHPFGAVLVPPDGERVLMKQGNLSSIADAETELSRRAFAEYQPRLLVDMLPW